MSIEQDQVSTSCREMCSRAAAGRHQPVLCADAGTTTAGLRQQSDVIDAASVDCKAATCAIRRTRPLNCKRVQPHLQRAPSKQTFLSSPAHHQTPKSLPGLLTQPSRPLSSCCSSARRTHSHKPVAGRAQHRLIDRNAKAMCPAQPTSPQQQSRLVCTSMHMTDHHHMPGLAPTRPAPSPEHKCPASMAAYDLL